jgi:hypothetical protein
MSVAEDHMAEAVNRRFAKFCCTSQCYAVFLRFVIWELISNNEGRVNVVIGGLLAAGGIERGTSSLMYSKITMKSPLLNLSGIHFIYY